MMWRMSEQDRQDSVQDQRPESSERLPWSSPTLTDLGAVSEVTQGISYNPGDGLSNLST
jgi:hypothetical protein